jgi:hypothetical protein
MAYGWCSLTDDVTVLICVPVALDVAVHDSGLR